MDFTNAAVCYTTYKRYNDGTGLGVWLDISDYCSKDGLFECLRDEFSDESDPEFLLVDHENIPRELIDGDDINENIFVLANCLEVKDVDLFLEWCEYFGHSLTENISKLETMFEDSYYGNMDMETFAEEYINSNYDIGNFPEHYIDYEAVISDLSEDFVEIGDCIFSSNN